MEEVNMADDKKVEKTEAKVKNTKQEGAEFFQRKMKASNQMSSPAKARRAVARLLNNRKVGK